MPASCEAPAGGAGNRGGSPGPPGAGCLAAAAAVVLLARDSFFRTRPPGNGPRPAGSPLLFTLGFSWATLWATLAASSPCARLLSHRTLSWNGSGSPQRPQPASPRACSEGGRSGLALLRGRVALPRPSACALPPPLPPSPPTGAGCPGCRDEHSGTYSEAPLTWNWGAESTPVLHAPDTVALGVFPPEPAPTLPGFLSCVCVCACMSIVRMCHVCRVSAGVCLCAYECNVCVSVMCVRVHAHVSAVCMSVMCMHT